MKVETERTIKVLLSKIDSQTTPDEALKYTQAALNIAHVINVTKSN